MALSLILCFGTAAGLFSDRFSLAPCDNQIWIMLACPVRQCGQPLTLTGPLATCPRGHSFDRARSGYWNLLQPQDRRSPHAGDSKAAVAARRRLHDRGLFTPILEALSQTLALVPHHSLLDVGCGEGSYLGPLAAASGCRAAGLDLSPAAIDLAARRYPHCTWVVANADRRLPFLSASFTHLISITARRHTAEFQRVLAPGGQLLIAVPGPFDLAELRGAGKSRRDVVLAEFPPPFTLTASRNVTFQIPAGEATLADFRLAIYRPRGPVASSQLTISLDFFTFTLP
jgi:23S rRNA (guanine745-N1)-methyltransferase